MSARVLVVLAILAGPAAFAENGPVLPNGVAAGDVDTTSAVLWARAETKGRLTFLFRPLGSLAGKIRTRTVFVDDPQVPVKVAIDRLIPGTEYVYAAFSWSDRKSRTGLFQTAAPPGVHTGLRFGVSGDSRGELSPYPAIVSALERRLDFFVNLGDTIYADVASPAVPKDQAESLEEFRRKHEEVLSEALGLNAVADLRSATAYLSVIDDHEVTNDFAGGAHPSSDPRFPFIDEEFINETALYRNGIAAFLEYNPIRKQLHSGTSDPRTEGKVKLYRSRRYGDDAALFLLDARSFRDEELPSVENPLDLAAVGEFLNASFDEGRTMLGRAQLDDLKKDLLLAERAGVTWKFIFVPEPIQNLGVLAASDRFEGYAAERTELLRFIDERDIANVVFVAADIHGTLVNNLTYQLGPFQPQIPLAAFEITTGPIAYDAPFGATVIRVAQERGFDLRPFYDPLSREGKDFFVTAILNVFLWLLGYDPIGLEGSPIDAQLLAGTYYSIHMYGWTELEIDRDTQALTVTTYGIDPYTEEDLHTNPDDVLSRRPQVVSRFRVTPK
jgi:phosphodiesterase/alkaline phosphatase D-like protein